MKKSNSIILFEPKPFQVIQRYGFNPLYAHENNPGGYTLGSGFVNISGEMPFNYKNGLEYRIVLLEDAYGKAFDWQPLDISQEGCKFSARVEISAGVWYKLEVRGMSDDCEYNTAVIEPFGIGEVFVIAGQSHATNCSDVQMKIEEPQGHITVYDFCTSVWRTAHDRQPCFDNDAFEGYQERGSIWPFAMDLLFQFIRVPIGLVNAGYGGTSTRQWLPGTVNFGNLIKACRWASDFRYVLWQQGESDVIEGIGTSTYINNLVTIKSELDAELESIHPWVLAKSTLHPTVYINPEGESQIRQAIEELCKLPGFLKGPDTDILGRSNRAGADTSAHLTCVGQKRAGLMWFSILWNLINEL